MFASISSSFNNTVWPLPSGKKYSIQWLTLLSGCDHIFTVASVLFTWLFTSIKWPADCLSKHWWIISNKSSVKYLELFFFYILTVGVIGPKKLVHDVLHFFCTLSNRRNTVHFSYVPSVWELELSWAGNALDVLLQWILDLSSYMFTF